MVSMGIDNRSALLIILIAINNFCFSQNLVPNSSFEIYKNRPLYLGGIRPMENWFSPTRGTPDVYKPKPNSVFFTQSNRFGSQTSQDGQLYTNIIFECVMGYEYVSVRLSESLIKDSLYCISFYKSLMDKSKFLMNGLGIDLSVEKPKIDKKQYVMDCMAVEGRRLFRYEYYKGKNVVKSDEICNDKENWTSSIFIYKAKGGEQYLTIGFFSEFREADFYNVRSEKKSNIPAFGFFGFYIDNVSLIPIPDSSECPCYKAKEQNILVTTPHEFDSIKSGEAVVLNNVLFETESSMLLHDSYFVLDSVAHYMQNNLSVTAEISGHTDNQGDSAMNMKLSQARAEAVVDYLVSKGIWRYKTDCDK